LRCGRGFVQKIAARFECRKTFTEYDANLGDPKVEAIIVAIADQFHVDSAIRALKAGKHVLVEKPLGTTISDCERLAAEVRDSELIAQVGTMKRVDPGIRDARRFLVDEGGEIWRPRRGAAIRSTARDPVHPDTLGEQLSAAIPGAALARITSKTESEVLHKVDLSRVLNDSLKPLKQELSR
jgi:predicted dehydrogenase